MSMKPIVARTLVVPDTVQRTVTSLGQLGHDWLRGLPDLVRTLAHEWELVVGRTLPGGSAAYVAEATTADGTAAVLKIRIPEYCTTQYPAAADEIRVLRCADGRGYVRLLRSDEACGALLLERLGPPLSQLGYSTTRQMTIICATLERAWIQMPEAVHLRSGAEKARWLRTSMADLWDVLDRPCSEAVLDQVLTFTLLREASFDPTHAVLAHGDAHSANMLAALPIDASAMESFKLVDPEGLFIERAYDLAISMRGWNEELLSGDALRLGQERCAYLSRLTGEDPEAIWQWGYIERVSTGLHLMQAGRVQEGRDTLRVAEAWV